MKNHIVTLKTLRAEFENTLSQPDHSVPRDYHFRDMPHMIQVAIGMRRTGKTFMLFQEIRRLLAEKIPLSRILYLNFEDDRLLPIDHTELAHLLDQFYTLFPENHHQPCYFFLDEIQNVDNWPIVIRRFMDSKDVKIYLTGSSAKLLSKEIASSLRGRSYAIEIWPYDFAEYLRCQHIAPPLTILDKPAEDQYKKYLTEYLMTGGFPAIQSLELAEQRKILQSYVDVVIYRDIIDRYRVTNLSLIKYLVKSMVNNAAGLYSPNKFFNDLKSKGFKVARDSIYEYMNYIEDAFLAFTVPLYAESLRKTQANPKKNYAIDSGLINAYSMSLSKNIGRMFENQFYISLRKCGHEIYYYKTHDGYEIDFFTRDAEGNFHLYQVVWDITDPDTLEREQRALACAEKELGITGELIDPIAFLQRFSVKK